MPSYSTSLKTWGSTGSEYPNNYDYVEGEQPVDAWDNFFNHNVVSDIQHLIDVTNNDLLAADGSVSVAGDLSDSNANLIYDFSAGHIEQSILENSSITISSGNGLTGGGTISLGGSTSFDIGTDAIQQTEIDLSIAPSWTGTHNFTAGLEASGAELDFSYGDGTTTCQVISENRFGGEGSSTTATAWNTIAGSDLVFNPDDYKDSNGNVYIRVKSHLKHAVNSGDVRARLYRQNAATAVSGTTVSLTLNDSWGTADTGWVDLSGDSGDESYQIQLESSDGESVRYNSIAIQFGHPQ